ncbi:hypothetical protein ACOMHN_042061 [Nucella lapillus]
MNNDWQRNKEKEDREAGDYTSGEIPKQLVSGDTGVAVVTENQDSHFHSESGIKSSAHTYASKESSNHSAEGKSSNTGQNQTLGNEKEHETHLRTDVDADTMDVNSGSVNVSREHGHRSDEGAQEEGKEENIQKTDADDTNKPSSCSETGDGDRTMDKGTEEEEADVDKESSFPHKGSDGVSNEDQVPQTCSLFDAFTSLPVQTPESCGQRSGIVFGCNPNVSTVQNDSADEYTVQNDSADVPSVQNDSADVSTVQNGSADVPTVQNDSADVPLVQNDSADVPAVQNGSADVPAIQNDKPEGITSGSDYGSAAQPSQAVSETDAKKRKATQGDQLDRERARSPSLTGQDDVDSSKIMDVPQHFDSECPTPLPEGKTSTPMPKDKASQDPTNFGSAPEGNVGIAVGRGRGRGFPKKEPGNSRRAILGKTAEQSPSQHKNERNFKTEDHQESKMSGSHQQLKIPESMYKATLPSSSTTHPENRDVGRGQDFRSSEAGQYIRGQEKDLTGSEDTETTICDQKKEEGDDLTKDPSGTASKEHKACGMESYNDHTEDCQEPDRSNSLQQQRKLESPTENLPPSSLSSAPSGGQESGSDHDRGGDKTGQTNRDQMKDTAVTENKKAPSWGQKQEETENLPSDQSTVTDPADSQWRGMSSPEGCTMQENTTKDSGLGDNSLASRENDSAIRSSEKTGEAAQLEMIV